MVDTVRGLIDQSWVVTDMASGGASTDQTPLTNISGM
jgi:hypothetical protein